MMMMMMMMMGLLLLPNKRLLLLLILVVVVAVVAVVVVAATGASEQEQKKQQLRSKALLLRQQQEGGGNNEGDEHEHERQLVVVPTWPDCYENNNNKICDTIDFASVVEQDNDISLWHTTLNDGSFINTNWDDIGFGGSQAMNADFTNSSFVESSANHIKFDNSILQGVDMTSTNFQHSSFRRTDMSSSTYDETTDFTNASFDLRTIFPDGKSLLNGTDFFGSGPDFNKMKLILDDTNISVDIQDMSAILKGKFTDYKGCSFNRMIAHSTDFLKSTDLSNSNMWQIQGEDMDLSNAILVNVPMHYSNLRRINLQGAMLTNTGLKHCNLQDCNLIGADLSTADFDTTTTLTGCSYDSTTVFPSGFDPKSQGLVDVNAEPLPTWPDCYDTNLKNCDTVDFTLTTDSSLWHTTFNDGSFCQTNWVGVGFGGSQLKNTDFTQADLRDASANHARFDNALLRQVDMTGTNFEHSSFRGADLTYAVTSSTTNFYGATFDTLTNFPDDLSWFDTNFFDDGDGGFNGMKLVLDDQDVSNLDLTISNKFTNFQGCSFNRMIGHGSNLSGVDLSFASMWQLQGEDMNLSYTTMIDVPVHYSNLKRLNLQGAILHGTGLKHTNLQDCNMIGTDLSQADILDTTTILIGCSYDTTTIFPTATVDDDGGLFDPISRGMINVDVTAADDDVPPRPTWPDCYDDDESSMNKNCDNVNFTLSTVSLWHETFNDGSFVKTNWANVGFGGSQAKYTNFTNANLNGASANHVDFQNAILHGVNLTGTNLEHTNIRGADLTSAIYDDDTTIFSFVAFDPSTIFFDGMTWSETNFFTTTTNDLKGMRLIMDDYQDANNMDFGSIVNSYVKSSFNRMHADGANFGGCDLTGVDMWSIQASSIDFSDTILTDVNLHYSSIVGANFQNAILTGTGLLNTNMAGCNLIGADLSSAELDATTTIMTDCTYDDTTIFPEGFDPLSYGLRDINAPTSSPSESPTTSSPTPAPTNPSLEDLANNRLVFDDIPCFPMGINLAGVVYYSNQWTFKNTFAESGACCYPAEAKCDSDGNLLEAAPENYPDYWKAGRNLIYRVDGQYPGGTYILHAQGNGTISLAFDVGQTQYVPVPTDPEGYAVTVTPSGGGVQLTIEETTETDPVRDISFMMEEYEHSTSSTSSFTPTFIETLSGMNVLRFMDMGATNGNNIVHWEDRNSLTSVSQSRVTRRIRDIASIAIPAEQREFTDVFGLEFTTVDPHDLSTGQVVDVDNLVGSVFVTREGGEDFEFHLSNVWFPKMVEVTGPNSFLINIGSWGWDKETDSITSISDDASADRAVLEIQSGVAYEYMIELAREVGSDPWFCVPHLASDEYVQNMAGMIANSGLGPETTVYVELSNEVWNSIFSQSHWAYGMERELGLPSSSQAYGQRAKQIFDIFAAAFAAVPTAPTLNRVLASQSVNTWISEQVIVGAGGSGSFDSLAIAPYFSPDATDVYELSANTNTTNGTFSVDGVTVTDVLELCVESIYGRFRQNLMEQKQVAEDYGGVLVAYEGGQHLGGQGNKPGGGRLEDDAPFQDLMIAANRDPRMHDLYQAYFKLWGEIVGPSGVFAHFSFIGQPSKWGSWGVKESYYKADTVEESPKWTSVKGIADTCVATAIAE